MTTKRYRTANLGAEELKALPLSPVEGFVLSRIEGELAEEDVVLGTGLDEGTVSAALERLVALGALRCDGSASKPLREASVLTPEERRLVDRLEAARNFGTHYDLLGVDPEAERRAIKAAYYELVAMLHPDRFAGRELGAEARRVQSLFAAVDAAHEVLAHREKRAQYDAQIALRGALHASEPSAQVRSAPIPVVSQAHVEPPISSSAIPTPPSPGAGAVLARKIGRASAPPPPLSSSREPASGPVSAPLSSRSRLEATSQAMAELKRRYEQLAPLARAEKLKALVAQGNVALEEGRGMDALQAFRLAQSIDAEDPAVVRGLARAEALASPEVGKHYAFFAKRAEYADQAGDARSFWEEAAQRAPDDAETQGRAAEALLRLEGDAAVALRCAGRAVLLEPKRAEFRALLGRAYLRQGMLRNAEREAQAAETLDAACTELIDLRRELAAKRPMG
jgi:curved DNA-binding protein CbpA